MLMIRDEQPGDAAGIRAVLEAAFPSAAEANLVDALRAACPEPLSVVGVEADRIVAHILFTPVTTGPDARLVRGVGLAPMAVVPDRQRAAIGSTLAREGIARLRRSGCPFIVVVGHPEYYPRFGFVRASRYGVCSQWEQMPDEAFMMLVLDSTVSEALAGVARYHPEFSRVT